MSKNKTFILEIVKKQKNKFVQAKKKDLTENFIFY